MLIRSDLLIISVTRTPKFSSITTTSPFAIGRLFTRISTGSPASLSSSMIEPGDNSNISFTDRFVLPSSTVLEVEYPSTYLNFLLQTPEVDRVQNSKTQQVVHSVGPLEE